MKFKFGAHSLMWMFKVQSRKKLLSAMKTVVKSGGTVFEIPYAICLLSWEVVAEVAKEAGITEIVICHFWPYDKKGAATLGDPLGSGEDIMRAQHTMEKIIDAALELRANGIIVRVIDGPLAFGLGKTYTEEIHELEEKMVVFLRFAGDRCKNAGLILAVEFLRPGEGTVIKGTVHMLRILMIVNNPSVMMHFDVHHSILHDEDPAEMICLAGSWIAHLHLHGDDRRMPGQEGDKRDWVAIIAAVNNIKSSIDYIVVICEPFGSATCRANKALGTGMPDVPPPYKYLTRARKVFTDSGLALSA